MAPARIPHGPANSIAMHKCASSARQDLAFEDIAGGQLGSVVLTKDGASVRLTCLMANHEHGTFAIHGDNPTSSHTAQGKI
jgi:hypothetical protein